MLVNADCVLIGQEPRIAVHREEMGTRLARALDGRTATVSVRATTTDFLGFTGRGEGLAAQAVALLLRSGAARVGEDSSCRPPRARRGRRGRVRRPPRRRVLPSARLLPPPGATSPPAAAGTSPRTGLLPRRLVACPARGADGREGHAPQRGIRARQTVAPRSMRAWAARPPKEWPVRRSTRSTLTSRGRTSSPKAKLRIAAAVYGPTPGSRVRSSGQPSRAIDRGRPVQGERAAVVSEPLPRTDHLARRGGGQRCRRRPSLEPVEVARPDALDLRLLQHHLRDENRVRVAWFAARGDRARSRRTRQAAAPPRTRIVGTSRHRGPQVHGLDAEAPLFPSPPRRT